MNGSEKICSRNQRKNFWHRILEKATAGPILEISAIHQAYQQRPGSSGWQINAAWDACDRHWRKVSQAQNPPMPRKKLNGHLKNLPVLWTQASLDRLCWNMKLALAESQIPTGIGQPWESDQ